MKVYFFFVIFLFHCSTSRQSCLLSAQVDVDQFCSYTIVSKTMAVEAACIYSLLELSDCNKKDNVWPVETN